MYDYCFKTCLATVAIATVLGVAAIWVPDAWYAVGAKLLWTDIVLFVGALAGALLSYVGSTKSHVESMREDIKQGQLRLLKGTK